MITNSITTNTQTTHGSCTGQVVHIALAGTFDSASLALMQSINGTPYPVLDDEGTAIAFTEAADATFSFSEGDEIWLLPSGGGGSMDIDFKISGVVAIYE